MNEKTEALLQKLEQGVKDVFDSNRYKEYLNFVSKFHKYSYFNTILILSQNKNATDVAGFKTWNSMKRFIKKGEKGITILAPSFTKNQKPLKDENNQIIKDEKGEPILEPAVKLNYFVPVHVFDVSQTDGESLPQIAPPLIGKVENASALFGILERISPYPIYVEELPGDVKGLCDYTNNKIIISDRLSQIHALKTIIHEIAHAKLHIVDNKLVEMSTSAKEVEAESVAYVVCQHLSIDTSEYSFDYIADWGKDKEVKQLKNSLSVISKQANEMINEIDNILSHIHEHSHNYQDR